MNIHYRITIEKINVNADSSIDKQAYLQCPHVTSYKEDEEIQNTLSNIHKTHKTHKIFVLSTTKFGLWQLCYEYMSSPNIARTETICYTLLKASFFEDGSLFRQQIIPNINKYMFSISIYIGAGIFCVIG